MSFYGKIYIDLNTFAGSKGATLYTLAHELTHFIENNAPAQYKVLTDFLINEYDKTGKSMDERVKDKQKELEYLWDRDVSYDEAFREVVADSMQKLFNDGNLQNELVKLKESSPEGARVVQAIKNFLDKLIKRVRSIYSKLTTGSADAEAVAQMGESLQKLQKIFAAALVEASDNYTAYGAVDKNAKISSSEAQFQARKQSNKTDFSQDFDYSALNWAADLGIITGKDRAIFERTINNEIFRGAEPQSANGEYIIDTGRCLMFTDGDFHNPTLSRVVEFGTEYESLTADAKEWIINEAKATGDIQKSIALIKTGFGSEFVSLHYAPDGTTNGGQNRGGKGSDRSGTYQKARSLKERLADEGIFLDEDTQFQARNYTPNGYGGIREALAKKGLDELSKKLGNNFPLSAQFDSTMRADKTPLVMETVLANGVQRAQKESAFATGKRAFRAAYGSKTSVHINQMEINADLYVDVAKESIDKAQGKPDEQSTLDVIPHIRNILENSILMGMERIAHTDNKGTVLYGYRLYNLYWYQNGNKKTPNCLVCTVVQDLNKAEGYVFQNIENVTVRHGLPGENTGMPEPSNGNTYTVSQLYDAVKKIDRENGGLKYSDAQRDKYLFNYTERNDGVSYQARPSEETSNRYLLANALESAAQTDEERQKLQQYREQIQNAENLEDRLDKLNRRIFEYSFAPGPRDTAKLNEMRETAKRMARQLDKMDKKLLGLEATKPMKDLVERERKLERLNCYGILSQIDNINWRLC